MLGACQAKTLSLPHTLAAGWLTPLTSWLYGPPRIVPEKCWSGAALCSLHQTQTFHSRQFSAFTNLLSQNHSTDIIRATKTKTPVVILEASDEDARRISTAPPSSRVASSLQCPPRPPSISTTAKISLDLALPFVYISLVEICARKAGDTSRFFFFRDASRPRPSVALTG